VLCLEGFLTRAVELYFFKETQEIVKEETDFHITEAPYIAAMILGLKMGEGKTQDLIKKYSPLQKKERLFFPVFLKNLF